MEHIYVNAGELSQRISVLQIRHSVSKAEWAESGRTRAKTTVNPKRTIWSSLGVGVAGVTFLIRKRPLRLEDAIVWNGRHHFITAIVPYGKNHIQVETVPVTIFACADRHTGISFPGILTEEYRRHDQLSPQSVNTTRHVLVTPKCITLTPGRLVDVEGTAWPILTAHDLDPYKNEYVLERVVDL